MKNISLVIVFLIPFISISQSDNCASAVSITPSFTVCNYQVGTSTNATQSIPTCSAGGFADDDVWYSFVANSASTTIKVDPSVGYDPVVQLFSGNCGSLTSIQCQDLNGLNGDENLTVTTLVPGNTYFIRVYHYGIGSGTGTFNICVKGLAPPNNNTPCNAYNLPSVTPSCDFQTYTNLGSAGSSVPTPSGCGGSSPFQGGYAGGDVWFSVVVPPSGQLDIHTLGIDFSDGAMALYSGPCSSPVLVECDDDGDPGDGILMPHIYRTGLTPGTTMYIRVWEYGNNNNGKFGICVSTPDNDNCANAQLICDLNGYGGITSSAYTIDQPSNMCGIGNPSSPNPGCVFGTGYTGTSPVQIDNNSWLAFVADSSIAQLFVQVNACSNGNGMQMQIFSGTNCTNFTAVSNFLETTTSQTVTATGLIKGNLYYIVVDGFAGDICSYTITATSGIDIVRINPANIDICIGQSTNLSAIVSGSGSYSYNWSSTPAGFTSTSQNVSVSPTQNTLYTVQVTGKCGKVTTANAYVGVHPYPTVAITASDTSVCEGVSISLNGNPSGGTSPYSHSWNGNGAGSLNNTNIVNPNFNNNSAGSYKLVYQVTDTIGCSVSDSINLTVNPTPVAGISGDDTICSGETITLQGSGGGNYLWSNSATTDSISVSPSSNSNYSVIVSNNFNCSDTAFHTVIVNPTPNITISGLDSICNGDSTTLSSSGANTYLWNTSATSTSITVSPPSNTNYTVVGTDNNGCMDSASFNVTVLPNPDVTISGLDSICIGESLTLSASGAQNYAWNTGSNSSSISISPLSSTNYSVIGLAGKCSDTAYHSVFVKPLPFIDAKNDTTIYLGQSKKLVALGSNNYTWFPPYGLSCKDCAEPIATPEQTTTYCVRTTVNGCSDTACVTITVDESCGEVFVPTAFSPNGDLNNDCIKAYGNCLETILLRIYSRWGELLFETEDVDACWDGTFKGKPLNTGVYTYTAAGTLANGEEFSMKGNFSLFR